MSAENMEVRWFWSHFSESVFTYQDGQEQNEELMAQYAGRTSLMGEYLKEGEAAVRIHKVQAADNGLYTCFFSNGVFVGQARLELQVAGVGSAPQVHITGPEEDRVLMVCTASGWFPEPQVQWRHPRGEQFLEFSKVQAQDTEGLFSVEATLVVNSGEKFQVIGPSEPIVAELGEDIILPCSLFPIMSAENMEVRWFRSHFSESVFIYQDRQELNEKLMAQYAGRTSLMGEFLREGEAAVTVHKVQASDNGLYTCFFSNGVFDGQASLELQVAGVGSPPQVHITGPEEEGLRVLCMASGWFPEPQVQWRHPHGEEFLEFSKVYTKDTEGLFSVEAALVVRDRSTRTVTCSILNPRMKHQEKAMTIVIPEPFFPRTSPWKPAFLVILTLLLLLLLGAACYAQREHSTKKRELQKQGTLHQTKEEDRQTKEEALKDRDERKAAYLAAWRKAQLYADWRKEQFQACE
ncbi:butyrophilin-like protein 2 [Talpa occidentalis]|uniref:butyrophilin-like protein 2 n=1 Tax=Talpa occidentalis TaxID=50954 RepID=UPI0023F77523|nr:butyrophilin-like protein 2 [Talpa occidentalis]